MFKKNVTLYLLNPINLHSVPLMWQKLQMSGFNLCRVQIFTLQIVQSLKNTLLFPVLNMKVIVL